MAEQTSNPRNTETGRSIELPDGRQAVVAEPRGEHLVKAGRMVGANEPMRLMMGLVAATTTLDGQALTIEDVEALPLWVLNPLMQEVGGGNAPSLPGSTSLN